MDMREKSGQVFERSIMKSKELTPFQKAVLLETLKVPRGTVITYKELAHKIRKSRAHRAVGNALKINPLRLALPCHRVVRSDNSIRLFRKEA